MKLGAPYPSSLFGPDVKPLAYYLQALEEMGYDYIGVGDHILGADRSVRPDWRPYSGKPPLWDVTDTFHEPMVALSWLGALSKKLELSTLFILPQRQTALVAKQAAELDYLTGGRLRLIPAAGWNDVEFEGLGMDYKNRGSRMEEQIVLMRELWKHDVITFKGKWHTITAAGLGGPMPVQRPIPIWLGGGSDRVLERVGRLGDGWFPYYHPAFNEKRIKRDWEKIKQHAREAGRDTAKIGFQGTTYFDDPRFEPLEGDRPVAKTIDEGVAEAFAFKAMGATHYSVAALGIDATNALQEANALRSLGDPRYAQAPSGLSKGGPKSADKQLEALRKFKEQLGKNF